MWRLVKADIQYYWYILLISFTLACVLLGFVGFVKGWPEPEIDLLGTRSLLMMMAAVAFFYRILRSMMEKRDRHHILLPLSGAKTALSRLLFIICLWTFFVFVYALSTLTVKPYSVGIILFEMLSATGFVLMANALPYIHHDFVLCLQRNYQKTLWMIIYVALASLGVVLFLSFAVTESSWKILKFFLPLKSKLDPITTSMLGAGVFLAFGIGLTWLSVSVFKRRKTYRD